MAFMILLSEVYTLVVSYLKESLDRGDLEKFLPSSLGFLSGIEFKEHGMNISVNCKAMAKKGMVFQLCVGFANVLISNSEKPFSVCIGDSVLVREVDSVVLTPKCKRSIRSWRIVFQDENGVRQDHSTKTKESRLEKKRKESPEVDDNDDVDMEGSDGGGGGGGGDDDEPVTGNGIGARIAARAARGRSRNNVSKNSIMDPPRRLNRQKELRKLVNEKARHRLTANVGETIPETKSREFVSYTLQLILPIFDYAYPFHISTIKNVSETVEGQFCYLRVNFTNTIVLPVLDADDDQPDCVYIKELTYRALNDWKGPEISRNVSKLNTVYHAIKDHQKRFREKEAQKKEMEGVVRQGVLNTDNRYNNPRPLLRDLLMRPSTTQKRINGVLEGYDNGIRYFTSKNEVTDILFSNVKHAFYQTCDNEMIIGLHFHLINPIMIGKKKQSDIQFYKPVGEIATDLIKNRGRGDAEEWEVEQAEREMKQKYKMKFSEFVRRLEEISKNSIKFETTIREIGFYGTPSRAMCLLTPTHSCLVNITEWPPFVVSLDEIELVHFERVDRALRNFDMVFIPKDYSRKVITVCSINTKQLDNIKDWLTNCDIAFTEGVQNMNWPKVLRAIMDDYDGFFDSGGWDFLCSDSSDEDEKRGSGLDDSDGAYEPSEMDDSDDDDDDEEVEYEAYSEDEEEAEYSSDGSAVDDEDDEDQSGKDWSELEEEARRDDMAKLQDIGVSRFGNRKQGKALRTPQKRRGTSGTGGFGAKPKKRR
ncbi:hypothetical protein ACOME3_006645 [Neoechinorhynchus agilis]